MTIYLDADSCPVAARDMVRRFANRLRLPVVYVANRPIPRPGSRSGGMVIVGEESDAADDYIVSEARRGDVVITRDIPLASRLVSQGITVLNDRGITFTPDNIRERLSLRNFHVALADVGIKPDRTGAYGKADLNNFACALDRLLHSKDASGEPSPSVFSR